MGDQAALTAAGHVDAAFAADGLLGGARELGRLGPRIVNGGAASALGAGSAVRGTAGMVTGPLSMAQGAVNVANGQYSQGVLDLASGGLGVASSGLALAGVAFPPLAVGAGVAGLAAYGNEDAEQAGFYGRAPDGGHATFLSSIGDRMSGAYAAARRLYGSSLPERVIGSAVGGVAAGGAGAGQTLYNAAGAAFYGGRRLGGLAADAGRVVGRTLNVSGAPSEPNPTASGPMNFNYF